MLTPRRQEMGDDGVTMSRGEEMGDQTVGGRNGWLLKFNRNSVIVQPVNYSIG